MENLTFVYRDIMKRPIDTEWIKICNHISTPQEIADLIPLISHATALAGMDHGYVVWGVENETRQVVGTSFKPYLEKKGKKKLITWLAGLFQPKIDFHFLELEIDHKPIVILEISSFIIMGKN